MSTLSHLPNPFSPHSQTITLPTFGGKHLKKKKHTQRSFLVFTEHNTNTNTVHIETTTYTHKHELPKPKTEFRETKKCSLKRMAWRETQGCKPFLKPSESCLTFLNKVSFLLFFSKKLFLFAALSALYWHYLVVAVSFRTFIEQICSYVWFFRTLYIFLYCGFIKLENIIK